MSCGESAWSGLEMVMSAGSPSSKETVPALIRQAEELRTARQVAAAVPVLERATRLDPTNISAWTQLGYTLSLVNRFAEAAWAYQRVVELDPDDAASWRNLGYAFRMQRRPREALVAYDRAIAMEPNYGEVWNRRATALQMLGRFAEMLQASERARALDVTNVRAWNNAGTALAGLKRYPEALEAFERTLALDPTVAWFWRNKASVLSHLGRNAEGLEAIETGLTLAPNDTHLWQVKIRILRRLRRFPQMWRAMAHTTTLPFTPSELPVPTEEEEAAEQEAYSLRGLMIQMLLVPWRRLHPAAYATANADTAVLERVIRWGIWLIGLCYLGAGLTLSAVWFSQAGGASGFAGTALRLATTGLCGLLAQALGAGAMVVLGRLGPRFAPRPEDTAPVRAHLKAAATLIALVLGILAIPLVAFVYALVQVRALSGISRQQTLLMFLGGMALVGMIVLVVNGIEARKTTRLVVSPPLPARLTNS
jgi:tetratricopeptide (TPR) repeat protein